MMPSECGQLLRACSYFDNRKVTEEAMVAWSHSIGQDMAISDALAAITAHYAQTAEWIGPSHINARVGLIRRERLQRAGTPPIPGGLEYADEKAWRQLWCSAVKDGDPDPEGVANTAMRITPQELTENRRRVRAIEALAESKTIGA